MSRSGLARSQACHHPGAASDIQYVLARAKLGAMHEVVRPLRGNRGHEVALIKFCRTAFQLPVAITHRCPHLWQYSRRGVGNMRCAPVSGQTGDRLAMSAFPLT